MAQPNHLAGATLCVAALALGGVTACAPAAEPSSRNLPEGHVATVDVPKTPATSGSEFSATPEEPGVKPSAPVIDRKRLEAIKAEGPPWILQRVQVEEVLRAGVLHGWRIRSMPASWAIDLGPGDIVTTINGLPIATPKDFMAAWTTLFELDELKIAYERAGKVRELTVPIVD